MIQSHFMPNLDGKSKKSEDERRACLRIPYSSSSSLLLLLPHCSSSSLSLGQTQSPPLYSHLTYTQGIKDGGRDYVATSGERCPPPNLSGLIRKWLGNLFQKHVVAKLQRYPDMKG